MFKSLKEKFIAWVIKGVIDRKPLQTRLAKIKIDEWFRRYEMDTSKKWYQSKTLWINALTGIAGLLTALMGTQGLDPKIVGAIGSILALVNIGLRLVTDKPICLDV